MPWPPLLLLALGCCLSEAASNATASPRRIDLCVGRGSPPELSLICFLRQWTPGAKELSRFNRSEVARLRMKIWGKSNRLTAAHLRGFSRLRALAVIGTCHDTFPYRNTGFCEASSGISAVEASAFRGAPELRTLHLVTHPLSRLQNLQHLSRLSRLHLQSMSHLEEILPSALNPIRANIEHIQLQDNNVARLDAWMFAGMARLREFHWSGAFTFVASGCLVDLPRLESVALRVRASSMTIGHTEPTLQPSALARLPRLREFLLHNMDHKADSPFATSTSAAPFATAAPPRPLCDIEGSEMQTVHATNVHVTVLHLCRGIFSCPACGADPDRRPQRIHLQRIYGSSGQAFALKDIFPGQDGFNVTELELIATRVDRVTDELGGMPLLRKLRLHRGVFMQMRHSDNLRVGNIRRLSVNPFKFLPAPQLLDSVRIIINDCDCVTLETIEWFQALARQRGARAADILMLGCENLKCTCGEVTKGSVPLGDSTMPWQDLETMVHILRPLCAKAKNVSFSDAELMCHAKCTTLKTLNLSAGAARTLPWAWLGLSLVLASVS